MPNPLIKGRSGDAPYKTRASSYVSTTFSSSTTFTTPKADYLEIEMLGAGGGSSQFGSNPVGGVGGKLTFTMSCRDNKTLTLTIGSGGATSGPLGSATNAGGGGATIITMGSTTIAIAGGGGGAGGTRNDFDGETGGGNGGNGGGTTAQAGADTTNFGWCIGGGGGTQSANGAGGTVTVPSYHQAAGGSGTTGGSADGIYAGNGGMGYKNGGGGSAASRFGDTLYNLAASGGGGGSNYIHPDTIPQVTITSVSNYVGGGRGQSGYNGLSGTIKISYYEYNF